METLSIIGPLLSAILAYILWHKQRKKVREEKFENAIQDYGLTAKPTGNSSIYENFSVRYVIWDKNKQINWLKDHHITELTAFYKWMDTKAPGWDWLKRIKK